MKVLLVNGSPHEHGCTYTAICEVEKALREDGVLTEHFWIGARPIAGCIGCGGCRRNGGRCVFGGCIFDIDEKTGKTVGVERILIR